MEKVRLRTRRRGPSRPACGTSGSVPSPVAHPVFPVCASLSRAASGGNALRGVGQTASDPSLDLALDLGEDHLVGDAGGERRAHHGGLLRPVERLEHGEERREVAARGRAVHGVERGSGV